MSATTDAYRGALEAVDRIVNRVKAPLGATSRAPGARTSAGPLDDLTPADGNGTNGNTAGRRRRTRA